MEKTKKINLEENKDKQVLWNQTLNILKNEVIKRKAALDGVSIDFSEGNKYGIFAENSNQ